MIHILPFFHHMMIHLTFHFHIRPGYRGHLPNGHANV